MPASEQPLSGRHILITRPVTRHDNENEEDPLHRQLRDWGATVSNIPLITIAPASFTINPDNIYEWLFFTSKNGVSAFYDGLQGSRQQFRDLPVATVGPATAHRLNRYGLSAHFVSPAHHADAAARSFCQHHGRPGIQVLWPCGNLADQTPVAIFREAGMTLHPLTVYETRPRETITPTEIQVFNRPIDLVVFTSPSALQALLTLAQKTLHMDLSKLPNATLGPKSREAAETLLGRADITAHPHTLIALANGIRDYFANLSA